MMPNMQMLKKRDAEGRWCEPTIQPRTDVVEFDDHFEIEMELPGVPSDKVNLQVEQSELRVCAERFRAKEESGFILTERRHGIYCRVFHLGEGIDRDQITGRMTDGVLRIRLPKVASALPKKIEIQH